MLQLSETEKQQIIDIASQALLKYYGIKQKGGLDASNLQPALNEKYGVFVSLYNDNDLCGCIGNIIGQKPLSESVKTLAVSAANDRRFDKPGKKEIEKLSFEISVLSPLKKINSIDEIELGRHGIYIKSAYDSGTFLPQVAIKTGWTVEEFVGHCSRDKAHLGWDGWKSAEMFTYEATIFKAPITYDPN